MKARKIVYILSMMLIMGLYSGVLYANEGYNIEAVTVVKNDKEIEILQSQDQYLQITQIGQNSESIKINTSTFEESLLLSGKISKGTQVVIKIFQNEKCQVDYDLTVGITGTFGQTLELSEGNNEVHVYYANSEAKVEDYVVFYICKESEESMKKLENWLDVPKLVG